MTKTRDFWFRRGGGVKPRSCWDSSWYVDMYGTEKQAKKREGLKTFCFQTFTRMTGVSIKPGEVKHVRATFEVVDE